jgi:hypothetical protein
VATATLSNPQLKLARQISEFYADPLGFVRFAYPWGEPGPLEDYNGPDTWQIETLLSIGAEVRKRRFDGHTPVAPIRMATASGHGIGKSALVAWLVDWIMSTRPYAQGTVTANTYTQLSTKTWARVKFWTKLCITGHWFTLNNDKMYRNGYGDSWFCTPQTCDKDNSEAFAGQHAANSTSFYIADEASSIPDETFEVMEGGLTDGEPMIYAFGNATRNQGKFHRVIFGSERGSWIHRSIDSRNCKMSNKELIQEWIDLWGADSDFVRVRVLGIPPRASEAQFIDMERIHEAQKRPAIVLKDEPLIVGVDMAWGGDDDNVIRFRRGLDARSIKPIRIKGEFTRSPDVMVGRLGEILTKDYDGHKVSQMFVDSAGIAGPVVHRLNQLGHRNVSEINFMADSPDMKYANMRAFMWGKVRDWLLKGSIDGEHRGGVNCDHCQLEADLSGPGFTHNTKVQVLLEDKAHMKKRGVDSPDDGDALALTFARPVLIKSQAKPKYDEFSEVSRLDTGWMT